MHALLERAGVDALVLDSPGALSWYLDGARVTVSAAGDPIAAAVVTRDADTVVVGANEVDRLVAEELPADVSTHVVDWWTPPAAAAREAAGASALLESQVALELRAARAALLPGELARYRSLCGDAARVLTDALSTAEPGESERSLAARIGAGAIAQGAEPVVVLVAGATRLAHRHPLPTAALLGRRSMAVLCARRNGLIANVTRWVRFGAARAEDVDATDRLLEVEADVLDASRPGAGVADVLDVVRSSYGRHGFAADEWRRHHQGGPCGYVGRDPRAVDGVPDVLRAGQAVAWNPTAPGVKVEDTVLVTDAGIDVLTTDARWPTVTRRGRLRPDEWEN
jgi:Xaa-Pro aminopeptidase